MPHCSQHPLKKSIHHRPTSHQVSQQIPSLAMFGMNRKTLKSKKEELDKFALGAWQLIARPMAWLVRYPFIAPELLEFIQLDPDFQTIALNDDKGTPLVMRAITHQHSSALRVSSELRKENLWHWETPRVGSTLYSGEWEWIYGPGAMKHSFEYVDENTGDVRPGFESYQGIRKEHPGKTRLSDLAMKICAQQLDHKPQDLEHPMWDQYLETNFPFSTPQEVKALGLAKLDIKKLDIDGDGTPSVDDMLVTFRHCMPMPGGESRYLEIRIDSIANLPKRDNIVMGGKCGERPATLEHQTFGAPAACAQPHLQPCHTQTAVRFNVFQQSSNLLCLASLSFLFLRPKCTTDEWVPVVDPYAVLKYERQVFKTSIKPNTLEATWDEVFVFQVALGSEQKLEITFYDSDRFGKDEIIGHYVISSDRIKEMVAKFNPEMFEGPELKFVNRFVPFVRDQVSRRISLHRTLPHLAAVVYVFFSSSHGIPSDG